MKTNINISILTFLDTASNNCDNGVDDMEANQAAQFQVDPHVEITDDVRYSYNKYLTIAKQANS